jgi:hypothetical protein
MGWATSRGTEEQQPFDAIAPGRLHHVGLDHQVLVDEVCRKAVVGLDAPYLGGGEYDQIGPLFGEKGPHRRLVHQIEFRVGAGDQVAVATGPQGPADGRPDHAAMAGEKNFRLQVHDDRSRV